MDKKDLHSGFKIGPWHVLPLRGQIEGDAGIHHMEPKVMDVLVCLARRAGNVVERDTIIGEVWGGRFVSDDPLSKCIAELRKVLGDSAREPRFIRTVHKRGYQLIPPVEILAASQRTVDKGVDTAPSTRSFLRVVGMLAILATAVVTSWHFINRDSSSVAESVEHGLPVLAVMPFGGGNPDDSYLVDGLRNELLTRLASSSAWRVVAKSSTDQFHSSASAPEAIAAALGVTDIVEGDVQRDGDTIRINVRLIDAASDEHIWAETYERDLTVSSLLNVQRQIVDRISTALEVKISQQPAGVSQAQPTTSLPAYTAYLRGRRAASAESIQSLTRAIEDFEKAIQLDPDFALAYAAAADAYLTLGAYFQGGLSVDESIELAQPLLERAQALDPDIAEAHAATGMMHMVRYDARSAEQSFLRAIELQPSYARVYALFSNLRWNQGRRDEAISLSKKALELDRWSAAINLDLARYYDQSGRFQEAMEQYVHVVNIEPDNAFAPLYVGALKYLAFGDVVDSIVWYHDAATRDSASPSVQAVPALAYMELGDLESAAFWVERGMSIDSNIFWPRVCSLFLNQRNGRFEAAVEDARVLHGLYPQARDALRILMDRDIEAGTPTVALARYARAHPELTESEVPKPNRENLFAAVDLGRLLIVLGEKERAATLLDAALDAMATMDRLGTDGYWIMDVRALALQGRVDEALTALRQAVDDGWRVHTWYHLEIDPALDSLRGTDEFAAMRDEVYRDLAEQAERLERLKASGELAEPQPP